MSLLTNEKFTIGCPMIGAGITFLSRQEQYAEPETPFFLMVMIGIGVGLVLWGLKPKGDRVGRERGFATRDLKLPQRWHQIQRAAPIVVTNSLLGERTESVGVIGVGAK